MGIWTGEQTLACRHPDCEGPLAPGTHLSGGTGPSLRSGRQHRTSVPRTNAWLGIKAAHGQRPRLLWRCLLTGEVDRACLRDRRTQTLGKKAKKPARPPIEWKQLCLPRFPVLAEVFSQAFAKLIPGAPKPRLHCALAQAQHFRDAFR